MRPTRYPVEGARLCAASPRGFEGSRKEICVNDFSVQLAQANFAKAPPPLPTSPAFCPARQRPPSLGGTKECQCNLGELRWRPTVQRQDLRARLVRMDLCVNPHAGKCRFPYQRLSENYEGVATGNSSKVRLQVPTYHTCTWRRRRPNESKRGGMNCGATSLACWPDASIGDQS